MNGTTVYPEVSIDDISLSLSSTKLDTTVVDERSLSSNDSAPTADSICELEFPESFEDDKIRSFKEFRSMIPYLQSGDAEKVFFNCSSQILLNNIVVNAINDFFANRSMSPDAEFMVFDKTVEETRQLYGKLLGLSEDDADKICYTRDSSESLHLIQESFQFKKGDTILMIDNEFQHNNLSWLGFVENHPELELNLKFIDTNGDKNFIVDGDSIAQYMDESVKVLSLSLTMYQSGLQNNVKSITSKFPDVHTIVDLTQDVGFHPVDVQDLGCSAAFFSCFKGLSVPQGLGILYMNSEFLSCTKTLPPFVNIKGLAKFDSNAGAIVEDFDLKACIHSSNALKYEHSNKPNLQIYASHAILGYLLNDLGMDNVEKYLKFLRTKMEATLLKHGIELFDGETKSPNIVVANINNPEWMKFFKSKKCTVSQFRYITRFSIGIYNSVKDIDALDAILMEGVEKGLKFLV
ncbi:hypothetical protein DASC09_030130 [Saccharomycopsis crataegensis]|uniref:Aminotransferase class V domain-containing protein n=1 Tax=Saccharomycopsis crataegensis TaxID=43959 RepID=A0AAV5QLE4_9ASCO|nr:hypothetical protein DASC09_030130 [Saccharomycopsis crataegensis]